MVNVICSRLENLFEMQYEPGTEQATMMPGQVSRVLTKEDFDSYPPIRSART